MKIVLPLALLAAPALADPAGPPTVQVGDRVFLLGETPRATQELPRFLPLNDVDWVHDVLDADPLLGPMHVVFITEVARTPPSYMFSEKGVPSDFGSRELVLQHLRADGIRTEVRQADSKRLLYMEEGPAPTWAATCHLRRSEREGWSTLSYCLHRASYPADPSLALNLKIYWPPEPARIGAVFPAAAVRMVEIMTCLDVTHDVPATREEALARLADLRATNPDLRGCTLPDPPA